MSKARIGIVVVGHGTLAPSMVSAATGILGQVHGVVGVAIDSSASVDESRRKVAQAIETVDTGHGVLLLTDMFGGTPSNLCISFLQPHKIEVISGFNLPMIIKLAGNLQQQPLADIVSFIQNYGQKNIVNASQILEGNIDAATG
jgi:mannose PTS system EIIA component